MKTEIISVYTTGDGRDQALKLSEKTGAFCGLDHKSSLRLRLLSEEIIELIRPFTDKIHGEYWLEAEGKDIQIHLQTDIPMDLQTRSELLAVSSSGKNAAAKGFLGQIREMIASVTLPDDPETKEMSDQAFSLISIGSQMGAHYDGAYSWSMTAYVNQVNSINSEDSKAAQDELERSIVANLADEVTVSIIGSEVEVVIFKSFA